MQLICYSKMILLLSDTLRNSKRTSAVLLAEIGEAPDVAETDRKRQD